MPPLSHVNKLKYYLQGALGDFPDCLEGIMLGKESGGGSRQKRQAAVVRVIMRKLLSGLSRIHSLGLIHRDVSLPCSALIIADRRKYVIVRYLLIK